MRVTIRFISCRGVKAFVPFQKPPLYAAVSLGGRREKTPPDPDGGENPDWEGAAVAFDLDGQEQEQAVQFEVKAQVPLLGTKVVGTASVPVAYLAAADGAAPQHVSYQVKAPDGKANGTLSFTYEISGSGAGGPRLHAAPDGAPPKQGLGFGGAPPKPQLHTVPEGAPSSQGPSFCGAPTPPRPVAAYQRPPTGSFAPHGGGYPPPPSPSAPAPPRPVAAYQPPPTASFAPHSGGYPPPPSPPATESSSLYPPLHDLLPSSTYPPPPSTQPHPTMANPHFTTPNSSFYPSPPAAAPDSASVYPPPPDSCTTASTVPPANYMNSYPPQPPHPDSYPPPASNLSPLSSAYPPPPSGYPPPSSNLAPYPPLPSSYPPPASNLAPPSSAYPPPPSGYPPPSSNLAPYPPPPPESGSAYPVLPRSVDRELPYHPHPAPSSTYPPPPGGSLYPPPGAHHLELDGAGRTPYYYPPSGPRYP